PGAFPLRHAGHPLSLPTLAMNFARHELVAFFSQASSPVSLVNAPRVALARLTWQPMMQATVFPTSLLTWFSHARVADGGMYPAWTTPASSPPSGVPLVGSQ